jgi:hypothetical protein
MTLGVGPTSTETVGQVLELYDSSELKRSNDLLDGIEMLAERSEFGGFG